MAVQADGPGMLTVPVATQYFVLKRHSLAWGIYDGGGLETDQGRTHVQVLLVVHRDASRGPKADDTCKCTDYLACFYHLDCPRPVFVTAPDIKTIFKFLSIFVFHSAQ